MHELRIVLANYGRIDPENIQDYQAAGGYTALTKALKMSPAQVIEEIKVSGLRGRGGAGFPAGLKWEAVQRAEGSVKYVICNADEGEPGTYKDRLIMEGDPHRLLEAMVIAGYAVGASQGYIYCRGEYALAADRLIRAIGDATTAGFLGQNVLGTNFSFTVEVRLGAGSYVCGEETALLESLEGKRGEPRLKPPYPDSVGLWGKPTLVNNVETLANMPAIINRGGQWFRTIGAPNNPGTKVVTLSGDVKNRTFGEVPTSTTLRQVIFEIGGGVNADRTLKAVQVGGASGAWLSPAELDVELDYDALAKVGASLGSGAIFVLDETRDITEAVKCIARFFARESCGKCVPCREGTFRAYEIMQRIVAGKGNPGDLGELRLLGQLLPQTAFCGLGQTALTPIISSLNRYPADYETKLRY